MFSYSRSAIAYSNLYHMREDGMFFAKLEDICDMVPTEEAKTDGHRCLPVD